MGGSKSEYGSRDDGIVNRTYSECYCGVELNWDFFHLLFASKILKIDKFYCIINFHS